MRVFIDSSFLLSNEAEDFINNLSETVYIPLKAVDEINKVKSAIRIKEAIKKAHKNGKVEFIGSKEDLKENNLYEKTFSKLLDRFNIDFLTTDKKLARSIKKSAKNKKYHINFYYLKNGKLIGLKLNERLPKLKDLVVRSNNPLVPQQVTKVSEELIPINKLPEVVDTIYGNEPVLLKEVIASGGEGLIYKTDQNKIAKIYRKEKLTKRKEAKLEQMVKKNISYPGICFPTEILRDKEGNFLGFLMPQARGKELQKSIFVKKLFKKRFPNWKRTHIVLLAIEILKRINYLNQRGIILGDINPMNILVYSPKEIYFVDTDSYQIDDFPCPVGTVNFTAPEIQGVSFREALRSEAQERFAIATLMFMLMLPGKPPYSKKGGESPSENIKNSEFVYTVDGKNNDLIPKGDWASIWANLPPFLREAFYLSFQKGERFNNIQNRLSGETWQNIFEAYFDYLNNPSMGNEKKDEIFPKKKQVVKKAKSKKTQTKKREKPKLRKSTTRPKPKKEPEVKELYCRKCKKYYPEDQIKGGLCPNCRKTNPLPKSPFQVKQEKKELYCKNCHRVFPATEMQYGYCKECRDKLGIKSRPTPKVTIIPEGFKPKDIKTLYCRSCHRQVPADQVKNGLCRDCRERDFCKVCHKPFKKSELKAGMCPSCYQKGVFNPGYNPTFTCTSCGRPFDINELSGGLCPECRKKQKIRSKTEDTMKQVINQYFGNTPREALEKLVNWLSKN